MSYALSLRVPDGEPLPSRQELEDYFADLPDYEHADGLVTYRNADTEVYFYFGFGDPGADEEKSDPRVSLSCIVNYSRPTVFALEAVEELGPLVEEFGFEVVGDDGAWKGEYSAERFLSEWSRGNTFACEAVAAQLRTRPEHERVEFATSILPRAELERLWRWNDGRSDLKEQLGDEVFVPRITYVRRDGRVCSAVVWTDAIPIALPEVDLLLLVREELAPRKLLFLRGQPDLACARWSELAPLLDVGVPVAEPQLHHLLTQEPPVAALTDFFRVRPSADLKGIGVALDKVLDAELVRQVLEAQPIF